MKETRIMRHWTLKELSYKNPIYLVQFIDRHLNVFGKRSYNFVDLFPGVDEDYDIIYNAIPTDKYHLSHPVEIRKLIIEEPGWSKPKYLYNIVGTNIREDYEGKVDVVYTMDVGGDECLIIHNDILSVTLQQIKLKYKDHYVPGINRINGGYFGWVKEFNNYIFEKEFMGEFKDDCNMNNFSTIKMLLLTSPYTIYHDFSTSGHSINVIIDRYKKYIDSDDFESKYEQDLVGLIKLKRWIFNDICRNNFMRLFVFLVGLSDNNKTYQEDMKSLDNLLTEILNGN